MFTQQVPVVTSNDFEDNCYKTTPGSAYINDMLSVIHCTVIVFTFISYTGGRFYGSKSVTEPVTDTTTVLLQMYSYELRPRLTHMPQDNSTLT